MIKNLPRSFAFATMLTFFGASGYFACGDDNPTGPTNKTDGGGVKTDGTTGSTDGTRLDGPDSAQVDGMNGGGDASADGSAEET